MDRLDTICSLAKDFHQPHHSLKVGIWKYENDNDVVFYRITCKGFGIDNEVRRDWYYHEQSQGPEADFERAVEIGKMLGIGSMELKANGNGGDIEG